MLDGFLTWWWNFWRSLLWRRHERPYRPAFVPAPNAPDRRRAAWVETTVRVRHLAGCLLVARPFSAPQFDDLYADYEGMRSPRRARVHGP